MSSLTTNSSTSSSSSLYATASSSKRLTGLMSGLDTDELVKQLTIGTQNKIDSANQKKQIATWQQEAYQALIKSISEFQTKYFNSSSSSSSILNASFFNSTSIVNNSSYVKLSGLANVAQNMQIKSITALAKQASYVATNKVSSQAIQTGEIQSEWTKSAVTGATMKISFEGKDYTLTVGSDGKTSQTSDIVNQLNQQLKDQGLGDKLGASVDADGKFILKNKDDSSSSAVTIKSGSDALLSGLGLKANDSGTAVTGSDAVNEAYFTNHSIAAGSKLNLKIDGNDYTFTFTIPSALSLPVGAVDENYSKALETALNDAVKTNTDLKGKINFSVDSSGSVSLTSTEGKSIEITDGSKSLLNGLGFSSGGTISTTGTVNQSELYKTYLDESLSGSTLTFDLNGLSKMIAFNEADISRFNNVIDSPDATSTEEYKTQYKNSLGGYLQEKLDSAYGAGKVQVSVKDGALSFTTPGNDTDVLTISSSSKSGVLGVDGALRVYAGESNRINLNKTLRDVQGEFATQTKDADGNPVALPPLEASSNGTYDITVNGKEFSFKATDTINTIIKTINNDSDANVTVSYSSTLDRFTVVAKNGGANSKVEIHDTTPVENENITNSSNLTKILFGYDSIDGTTKGKDGKEVVQAGQDAELEVSFDNGQSFTKITRSSNSFTMDGVNFELQKTTPIKTVDGKEVPDMDPITFSVESKTDDLVTKIKTFIDDYNAILTTVNGLISEKKPTDATYAPLTDDQKSEMSESQITAWEKKAKQGLLFNDSLLSSFAQDWRHSMTDVVSSMSNALYQVGISSSSYSDNGKLTVDEDKLKEVLNSDPDKIAQLFTSTDGIATRMQNVMKKYANDSLVNTGLFITKAGSSTSTVDTSELAKKMKEYDTQVKTLKTRLTSQQEYYYNKFTALETYIARMNSQASFFTQSSSS
ncbi:flagellar filament capping protein FliD [Faecalispora jeddahensis]|uniref:flagellar filament capping protein FliD n=1 Tax=Faecalispora jeddahensis TaxID=1414721 RepID=UPI0028AB0283|nr:flagellar filament capping protein FliD [Faecalispora jeddahensis]